MKNKSPDLYQIHRDAFSNGQIDSKLWLCEELEKLFDQIDKIAIYGGWYGVSAFLLLSRKNIKVSNIHSFDIDPTCQPVADMINENWVFKNWQFKAFTEDCNNLNPADFDLIINTSTEHFKLLDWYDKIPEGKFVALQGNNMQHDDHHNVSNDLLDFCSRFKIKRELYRGQKTFVYPNKQFTRFMIIGQK